MAKVGLKDTLALLAKGYSKKEIDAMAEIDEQTADQAPAPDDKKETAPVVEKVPDTTPAPEPEPDYKKMYEDLLKEKEQELNEKNETIKKIQKENINSNSLPDVEKMREEEHTSLVNAIRSFY